MAGWEWKRRGREGVERVDYRIVGGYKLKFEAWENKGVREG
jgi:hypothetical protein